MLEKFDLARKAKKTEFKAAYDELAVTLGELQRRLTRDAVPVVVVVEGWNAAGKGTLINQLLLPLDPRGVQVRAIRPPTIEEQLYPFLWRFWRLLPARGQMVIFDRSWYQHVLADRVDARLEPQHLTSAFRDIEAFERQLAADGYVLLKFFLHISKAEQKARFQKLRRNPSTAWRVTDSDLRHHRQYREYLQVTDEMLVRSDYPYATWTVVESHDHRFATLKLLQTLISRLAAHLESQPASEREAAPPAHEPTALTTSLAPRALDCVDLSLSLARETYRRHLKPKQKQIRDLQHQLYVRRIPIVIVYEGWDAAGKGGNIRRLVQALDPRGYDVVPIQAPNDTERGHHYLWRFWTQLPKGGHMTIFDRSWYGRVLVERVEGFCSEDEWRRAYREINEMEAHLVDAGGIVLKFFMHIDQETQMRRFEARQETPHKRWKMTDEDWRNREKWTRYQPAVEEMLFRCSTTQAPWHIVESNCKLHARIKVLDTVIGTVRRRLQKGE